jgi:hypothetical protein
MKHHLSEKNAMQPNVEPAETRRWVRIVGWVISLLPVPLLLMSAVMKIVQPPGFNDGLAHLGWKPSDALGLAALEFACVAVYIIPRSSVLGAILLTGYLGGAIATHVRIGDPFFPARVVPLALGVLVWLGLLLRDERVRALLPLRQGPRPLPLLLKVPIAAAGIAIAAVVVVLLQPTEFRIDRSASIAAEPSEVFAQVNDFHNWDAWSPWKKLDPAATATFEGPPEGEGAIFKWSGNDEIGAGMMTLTESKPSERIKIKLDFFKPFKATNNTEFTFHAERDDTLVTWTMTGERDFMQKAVCLFMDIDKMVGGQFDEGLSNLRSAVQQQRQRASNGEAK